MGYFDAFGRFMGHVLQGEGEKALDVLSEAPASTPDRRKTVQSDQPEANRRAAVQPGAPVDLVECAGCHAFVASVGADGKCEGGCK